MEIWFGEHRRTHYCPTSENDLGQIALSAEREAEETAEREAFRLEREAQREKLRREWLSPDNDALFMPL
jgi:hypothetical protein